MNRGIRLTYAMASDPPDLQDFEAYPSVSSVYGETLTAGSDQCGSDW